MPFAYAYGLPLKSWCTTLENKMLQPKITYLMLLDLSFVFKETTHGLSKQGAASTAAKGKGKRHDYYSKQFLILTTLSFDFNEINS